MDTRADTLDSLHGRRSALLAAEALARGAGELLLKHFGRLDAADVHSKSTGRDLVSTADVLAERFIVERLRKIFPEHAIEAEEETRDAVKMRDLRPRWFIDPLDGTVNFVHGLPIFSVSMGLYSSLRDTPQLRPEVAVVYVPRLDEMFTAFRGGGAYLNGRLIRVSNTANLADAFLATGFPYRRNELRHNNLENFNKFFLDVRAIRRLGSAAMDLAYVAAGRFDGYWELHLSPHDVAAGALLVREAGGIVRDCDGGDDWLRAGHVVASNPALFEKIRERIVHR